MGANTSWVNFVLVDRWSPEGNFLVATAKSEDGFRKAQQLTEEATETPRRKEAVKGGIIR